MLTLLGAAAGLIAASGRTYFLATLLFEVTPTDLVALGFAIATMLIVGGAAANLPAPAPRVSIPWWP
jgi:hypothetical protein